MDNTTLPYYSKIRIPQFLITNIVTPIEMVLRNIYYYSPNILKFMFISTSRRALVRVLLYSRFQRSCRNPI